MEFCRVGPEKRRLSGALIRRLKNKFAPGGLLHFGQGKWYPANRFRAGPGLLLADGRQALWHDDSLLADEAASYGHTEREAAWFIHQLAHVLDVKAMHILPAYEDAWYYLWRERRLPTNVDPLESRLEDKEERARLARTFNQGLKKVAGYVLRSVTVGATDRTGPAALVPAGRTSVSGPR